MSKPSFVYVTYIRSSAARVWQALTEGDITRRYWSQHRNVSDWKPGSTWQHQDANDPAIVDVAGTIVESQPPRRLVMTWSAPDEVDDPSRRSRVTYDIVEDGDMVRFIVTHEDLDPDVLEGISTGWPIVLSGLKSLLETGEPLPEMWVRDGSGGWKQTRFASDPG